MSDENDIQIDLKSDVSEGEKARKKLAEVESQINQLKSSFEQGNVATAVYNKELKALEGQAGRAANALKAAEGGGKAAAGGFGIASNKLQVFAQGLDDLQYVPAQGLRPILNNLVQISPALGIAAIAVSTLYDNFDTLTGLFGQGHVKTQAEEMDELRKKTSLTADEAERLARATAIGAKVNELRAGKPEEERKTEDAVSKAIIEAGSRNVAGGVLKVAPELVDSQGDAAVAKQKVDEAQKWLDHEKEMAGDSGDMTAIPEAEKRLLEANLALAAARKKTAEELAATGALPSLFPNGLPQLQGLVDKDPGAFGPKGGQLSRDLKAASPQARQDERVKEAEDGIRDDLAKQDEKDAKDHADRVKRSDDAVDEVQRDLARQAEKDQRDKAQAEKDAVEKADKAEAGTGFKGRIDEALLRNALKSGGMGGIDKKAMEEAVSQELQGNGLSKEDADLAAHKKVTDQAGALGDKIAGMAMQGPAKMDAPNRIASADFARSVEASGAQDMKSIADSTAKMEKSLANIWTNVQRGARLVQ